MLKPASASTPKVPAMDSGIASAGMSVAQKPRRKRNTTATTSPTVSINVRWTSTRLARMVCVRSLTTSALTEAGSERSSAGSARLMASTVSTTLPPGCLWMSTMMARRPWIQAACFTSCGPDTACPMSRTRTGAPLCQARMRSLYSRAWVNWSVASIATDRFGPSSVPLGALAVAVPSTARTCSRLSPKASSLPGSTCTLMAGFCSPCRSISPTPGIRDSCWAMYESAKTSTSCRGKVSDDTAMDMIWKSAGLAFSQDGGLGNVLGSRPLAPLMAAWTSCAAASMLRPRSNWTVMEVPPDALVEVMSVTPGIRASWRSSGVATAVAMTSALAPGRSAETLIVGRSSCGSAASGIKA